ncbi:MAG: Fic family protein [Actinomycetota bacterium]
MLLFRDGPIAPLVDELDRWRAKLDYRGALPRTWAGRLRRDLEVESVAASTIMEGVPVTVEEVRRILAGDRPLRVSEVDAELVAGYRDAMGYALRRADDPGFRWDRELLTAVHDRVFGGHYDLGAGRLRTKAAWVADREAGVQVFAPPDPDGVPDLVDGACAALANEARHPAVVSAWVHVAVAAIHPFRDGNGRTARVLASLAMLRGGFKRPEFTSLEEWWGRHLTDYYAAFACLGATFYEDADVTPFIEAHLEAQLHQVRALDLRERTQRLIWQATESVVEACSLKRRVANALWDGFFGREITPRAYRSLVNVAVATATSDLTRATGAGLLAAQGEGRSRTYGCGPALYGAVAAEFGLDVPDEPEQARERIVSWATEAALRQESE